MAEVSALWNALDTLIGAWAETLNPYKYDFVATRDDDVVWEENHNKEPDWEALAADLEVALNMAYKLGQRAKPPAARPS